jgi:hypothetical protein
MILLQKVCILIIFIACLTKCNFAQDDPNDPFGIYGAVCMAGKAQLYNQNDSVHVPWFTIDLDQDPQTRWTEIGKAYGQKVKSCRTLYIAQRDEQNDTKFIQFENCFGLLKLKP